MANLMSIDWQFVHEDEKYQILVWLVNNDKATYKLDVVRSTLSGSENLGSKTVTTGWSNAFGDRNNPILARELNRLEQFIRHEF